MSYQDDKGVSLSPRNEEVPDAEEGKHYKGMESHSCRTKYFEKINDSIVMYISQMVPFHIHECTHPRSL